MEEIKKLSLVCEQCGGVLQVDQGKEVVACPFCSNKTLILESDEVTKERIRTAAQKEVELERLKADDRERQRNSEKEQRLEKEQLAEKFKKSKWFKLLIVAFLLAALCAYYCFSKGRTWAGILAVLQAGCFGVAWTMGMQIIREKRRFMHILIALIGFVLILPTFRACSVARDKKDVKEVKWSIIVLGEEIPEPESMKLEIHTNTSKELWIDVVETDEEAYYEYIEACKKAGYTVVVEENSIGYEAYTAEGYHLRLGKNSSEEEMSIHLEAPTVAEDLQWEKHDISKLLPAPKSTMGAFEQEATHRVAVIVSETSEEDFEAYKKVCIQKGFEVDATILNDSYSAYDIEGNKVGLYYTKGNSQMRIVLEYPEETKESEEENTSDKTMVAEPEPTDEAISIDIPAVDDNFIDPEFKEMMDEFEAFFDEYVEFVNRMNNADSMEALELMSAYTEYLEKYASVMEKMESIDQDELTTAEALYYAEVTGRIYLKLAKME